MMSECNHRWRLVAESDDDSLWWVICELCGEYGEHTQVNEQIEGLEAQRNELLAVCQEAVATFQHHEADLSYLGPLSVVAKLQTAIDKAKSDN